MSDYLDYWHVDAPIFLRQVKVEAGSRDFFFAPSRRQKAERLCLAYKHGPQAGLANERLGAVGTLAFIVGAAGTGKTTLLRWLCAQVDTASHDILLMAMVNKETQAGWLTPRIAAFMGIAIDPYLRARQAAPTDVSAGHSELLHATAARMDELITEGRHLIVAVDSAHLASTPEALGEIVAFLDIQAIAGTCLSFLLCGDLSMHGVMAKAASLATRSAFGLTLAELSREETAAYIAHRQQAAGVEVQYDDAAIDHIYARSRGIFAAIDAHAENCLIAACMRQARRISGEIASVAAESLLPLFAAVATPDLNPSQVPTAGSQDLLTVKSGAEKNTPRFPAGDFAATTIPSTGSKATAPAVPVDEAQGIKLKSLFKVKK